MQKTGVISLWTEQIKRAETGEEKCRMTGAIFGDIVGSVYEFHNTHNYDFVFLRNYSKPTDDSYMTLAVANALMESRGKDDDTIRVCLVKEMRRIGRMYPDAGYGGMFYGWLGLTDPKPYNSFGNGSAMRVSAAGFMASDEQQCVELATRTALPTHNHPEGIKGAVATALAIHYAMTGRDKDFIHDNVLNTYYPDWSQLRYVDILPGYRFEESCQRTVPAALICFLESKDYADSLKLAIALGGDADTLGAITGPMAYAFYREMPDELVKNAKNKLPQWMLDVNDEFDAAYGH